MPCGFSDWYMVIEALYLWCFRVIWYHLHLFSYCTAVHLQTLIHSMCVFFICCLQLILYVRWEHYSCVVTNILRDKTMNISQFFPCCMECQCRLAVRKVSICLSNACIETKQEKASWCQSDERQPHAVCGLMVEFCPKNRTEDYVPRDRCYAAAIALQTHHCRDKSVDS